MTVSDYEAIYDAMMETSRGRWFLNEYADRNRSADTVMLLDAIAKLELAISRPQALPGADRVLNGLLEMSKAIQKAREEIASIKAPDQQDGHIVSAMEELDAIVRATEYATNDILRAAENIQEMAWTLRESGVDNETCDELDARATDIYTACSFQDITGQRIQKVVHVLRYLEASLESLIEIWEPQRQKKMALNDSHLPEPVAQASPHRLESYQSQPVEADPRISYGTGPEIGFPQQQTESAFSESDLENFLKETGQSDSSVHYPPPAEYSPVAPDVTVRVRAPSRPAVGSLGGAATEDRPPSATDLHYSRAPAGPAAGTADAQTPGVQAPAENTGSPKPAPNAQGSIRSGKFRRPTALSVQTLDDTQKAVLFNEPSR